MTLTQAYLREALDYDPSSGEFTWRFRPREHFPTERGWKIANRHHAGKRAGYVDPGDGYRKIGIGGVNYLEQRLAWLHVNGVMPDEEVDHQSGQTAENAIGNLRDVSHAENMKNKAAYRNNTSGVPGVTFDRRKGLWAAVISVNGKQRRLGRSKDKERAIALRLAAEIAHGYHPNHGRAA